MMQIHVEYTYLNGGPKLKTFTSIRYIFQGGKSILYANKVNEYYHQHELAKSILRQCKNCVYIEMLNEHEEILTYRKRINNHNEVAWIYNDSINVTDIVL